VSALRTILLVEDDQNIATSLKKELEAEGFDVVTASSGDQGFQQAANRSFDLVLTDLKLPGASGLELIRKVHADQPALPVILMSAFANPEIEREALELGGSGVIGKPFEMADLLNQIRKILDWRT
jgi:DNA-binding response OmpR family regulator